MILSNLISLSYRYISVFDVYFLWLLWRSRDNNNWKSRLRTKQTRFNYIHYIQIHHFINSSAFLILVPHTTQTSVIKLPPFSLFSLSPSVSYSHSSRFSLITWLSNSFPFLTRLRTFFHFVFFSFTGNWCTYSFRFSHTLWFKQIKAYLHSGVIFVLLVFCLRIYLHWITTRIFLIFFISFWNSLLG